MNFFHSFLKKKYIFVLGHSNSTKHVIKDFPVVAITTLTDIFFISFIHFSAFNTNHT